MARLGVQQSGTSDFVVRTYVPSEFPNAQIVWVNSVDRLVRAGTSWYELVRAGTEVTNRREPRENRRTSRAQSIC